jgi:hypothetical protein
MGRQGSCQTERADPTSSDELPQTSILSRQVGDTYHVFVIVPYGGGPEKAIQVESALLVEQDSSVEEFGSLRDSLNLSALIQGRERYDLCRASRPETHVVCACSGV